MRALQLASDGLDQRVLLEGLDDGLASGADQGGKLRGCAPVR
jgi:hypothetical protein